MKDFWVEMIVSVKDQGKCGATLFRDQVEFTELGQLEVVEGVLGHEGTQEEPKVMHDSEGHLEGFFLDCGRS
jgi:hypothetical protein